MNVALLCCIQTIHIFVPPFKKPVILTHIEYSYSSSYSLRRLYQHQATHQQHITGRLFSYGEREYKNGGPSHNGP